jgi:hypothetical protein
MKDKYVSKYQDDVKEIALDDEALEKVIGGRSILEGGPSLLEGLELPNSKRYKGSLTIKIKKY